MKRKIENAVLLTATLVLTALTLACRKPAEVIEAPFLPTNEPAASTAPLQTDNPSTAEPTVMPTAAHAPNGDPPERPIFYSIEDYLLLASSVDLNDAECEKILYNNFGNDGIDTKADAIKTLEIINSMPFPVSEGLELISVELRYDYNTFYILYGIEGDENGFLSFHISLTGSDAQADSSEFEQKYSFVELPEMRNSELKYLARLLAEGTGDPDFPFIVRFFITNVRSHKIEIRTNLSEKDLVDILANCQFITMDEYAKKAAP